MSEGDAQPGDDEGPGAGWPVQIGGDCDRCAAEIQAIVGGAVRRITPRDARYLGPSTPNPEGRWEYHLVVVKGGRVFDAFTGRGGMSSREYKEQFLYEDDIHFDF